MEEVLMIEGHVWGDTLNIVFTDDINRSIKEQAEIHKFDPKDYLVEDYHDAVVCEIQEEEYRGCWTLFNFERCNIGIIVHECNHITFNLLNKRDIKLCEETMEVFAYTEQWVFNKVNNFWEELKAAEGNKPRQLELFNEKV